MRLAGHALLGVFVSIVTLDQPLWKTGVACAVLSAAVSCIVAAIPSNETPGGVS